MLFMARYIMQILSVVAFYHHYVCRGLFFFFFLLWPLHLFRYASFWANILRRSWRKVRYLHWKFQMIYWFFHVKKIMQFVRLFSIKVGICNSVFSSIEVYLSFVMRILFQPGCRSSSLQFRTSIEWDCYPEIRIREVRTCPLSGKNIKLRSADTRTEIRCMLVAPLAMGWFYLITQPDEILFINDLQ